MRRSESDSSPKRHAALSIIVPVQQLQPVHQTLRRQRRLFRLVLQNELVLRVVFGVLLLRGLFQRSVLHGSLVGRDVIHVSCVVAGRWGRGLCVGSVILSDGLVVGFPDPAPIVVVVVKVLCGLLSHLLFVGGVVFDLALSLPSGFWGVMPFVVTGCTLAALTMFLPGCCVVPRVVSIKPFFRFHSSSESLFEGAGLGHLGRGKELDGGATITTFFVCDFPFLGVLNQASLSIGCCC